MQRNYSRKINRRRKPYDHANCTEVTDGFFGGGGDKKPASGGDGKCEPPKKTAEQKKCPEPEKKKKESCQKPKKRESCRKKKSMPCIKPKKPKKCPMPRSRNPFIIFFLTMYFKQPSRRVTEVAREAGKQWSCMGPKDKEIYQKMACLERKRQMRKHKRSKKRGGTCRHQQRKRQKKCR